eukprot:TRINITY_DN27604_c0_g1_i4.p1 TRINITY_DN27604_c0_g1~~TRINITY_DN27604_c0_g1_i4.p1  ORF type:complete len:334 (+),score=9.25 TRINITY_DN27604_c0_g1_i4:3-1004(+)
MINWFRSKHGYKPNSNLFGFGYDFRQSNRSHIEALISKLKSIHKQCGGKRIDIVSHSMGGLVILSFLAQYPDMFEKYVDKWIAICCPFSGAPGFVMNALVNGTSFVSGWESCFFVQRETFLQMAIESPSMYEMLPQHWIGSSEEVPTTSVWIQDESGNPKLENYKFGSFKQLQEQVLNGNQVQISNVAVNLPQNEGCWQTASETFSIWKKVQLPSSCKFYNLHGIGFETPLSVTFGSQQEPLKSYQDVKDAHHSFQMIEGDGTVPAICSSTDNLEAVERKGFKGTHRGLLCSIEVFEQIAQWLKLPQAQDHQPLIQTDQFKLIQTDSTGWVLL